MTTMGSAAVVSSSASSAGAAGSSAAVTSLLSPVGTSIGGVAIAIALVYVLAHLNVITAGSGENEHLKRTLVAAAIPLGITFGGIVAFQTLALF